MTFTTIYCFRSTSVIFFWWTGTTPFFSFYFVGPNRSQILSAIITLWTPSLLRFRLKFLTRFVPAANYRKSGGIVEQCQWKSLPIRCSCNAEINKSFTVGARQYSRNFEDCGESREINTKNIHNILFTKSVESCAESFCERAGGSCCGWSRVCEIKFPNVLMNAVSKWKGK